jgi:hypothetical protein
MASPFALVDGRRAAAVTQQVSRTLTGRRHGNVSAGHRRRLPARLTLD